jgi:hypothetical protein
MTFTFELNPAGLKPMSKNKTNNKTKSHEKDRRLYKGERKNLPNRKWPLNAPERHYGR